MTESVAPPAVTVRGLAGIPEVRAGDDLAGLVLAAVERAGTPLDDGDVVVVTSKIISKAEGRVLPGDDREAAIDAETVRVVSQWRTPRGVTRIVENRQGLVMAAAGVDASNVEAGHVVLLPQDPDASARRLRADLLARTRLTRLGVVVTDTAGRAWRDGVVDLAIGAAGIRVVDDFRGRSDAHGNPLEVTVVALADEIASASELVRGKLAGVPVAVVHGLAHLVTDDDGPGARQLLRPSADDRFRLGTPDAMRAAVLQRRDVRRFTRTAVDVEVLERALAAADAAPSPATPPPWSLELVTESGAVKALSADHGDVSDAAAVIVAHTADRTAATLIALGAALENVMITLAADGVGSAYLFPADPDALGVVVVGHAAVEDL